MYFFLISLNGKNKIKRKNIELCNSYQWYVITLIHPCIVESSNDMNPWIVKSYRAVTRIVNRVILIIIMDLTQISSNLQSWTIHLIINIIEYSNKNGFWLQLSNGQNGKANFMHILWSISANGLHRLFL